MNEESELSEEFLKALKKEFERQENADCEYNRYRVAYKIIEDTANAIRDWL